MSDGGAVRVTRGLDELEGAEWDAYVSAHPQATADHLWGWQGVFRDVFDHECAYLSARRDGRITGVLPLVLFRSRLFGRSAVSVPFLNYGGVLESDHASGEALLAAARETAETFRASHIELRHQQRMFTDLPFRQHKLGFVRTLPGTVEELWRTTDRKVRNQVRKAQKEQLTTAHGGVELVDEFYRVFAENMRDLGTPVYSRRLFSVTAERFPDRVRIFIVRREGQPIAGGVAVRFRDTVLVPWASSLRAYRHLCANMLLYWSMLEHAVQNGAGTFDFGRSSPGAGTQQFKLQWGASEIPLHWEYALMTRESAPDQGPSNPKFNRVIELWKKLPLAIANGLGPYIVRHIP